MPFTPLTNYAGYEHVLNAMPTFVHKNGNIYGIAIEKQGGVRQNLVIYRKRPGFTLPEFVHRYVGGVDSASQIAAGGCVIDLTGALHTWASAVPLGLPPITKTGFVGGFWEPIAGVDDPWGQDTPQASGGGVKLFPAQLTNPAWEGRIMGPNVGEWVDIPATFGCPPAEAYIVRFVAQASQGDVRVRAGTQQAPAILTVNTQLPNIQVHTQGWAPGPLTWVSTVHAGAQVWFQIVGRAL